LSNEPCCRLSNNSQAKLVGTGSLGIDETVMTYLLQEYRAR
jgi:hypothetical protein